MDFLNYFYFFSVKKEEIAQLASALLSSLFSTLCLPGSSENEYVMKGMLIFLSEVFLHYTTLQNLTNHLNFCFCF